MPIKITLVNFNQEKTACQLLLELINQYYLQQLQEIRKLIILIVNYRGNIEWAPLKNFKHLQTHDNILITNIQLLMQKYDISEAELSRQTHIPQPTLHKILSGKTIDPRISTLKTLAGHFGISLDGLYSNDAYDFSEATPQGRSVPVISWEDCIKSKNPALNLTPTNWSEWIAVDNNQNKLIYALVSRPSMEPRFPRGTTLIVDPKTQPADGDLVVVQYIGTNEATLRELSIDGPNKLLFSFNQTIKPDRLNQNIKVIGTVIQSRFSYQD